MNLKNEDIEKKLNRVRQSRMARPASLLLRYLASGWPEWAGALLLLITLGIAINSIQQAQWISPQPSLLTVLIFSAVVAFPVAKSRLRLIDTVVIGIVAGLIATIWQATSVLPSPAEGNLFSRLLESLSSMVDTLVRNRPATGTIYFAIFLIAITWLLGYILIWRFVRKRSVWPAVFLGLAVLLVNLDFLSQSVYWYFFFYLFFAILLVSFTGFLKHYFSFRQNSTRYPVRGVLWFVALVVCLSAVLIGGTWAAPEIRANQLQTLTDARVQAGKTLDSLKLNLFAPVKAKGAIIKTVDQTNMNFSSPPNLSHDIQFLVISPNAPTYWRVRRYDIYSASGWSTSPAEESVITSGFSESARAGAAPDNTTTYSVINQLKTDVVLTAGQLITAGNTFLKHTFAGTEGASAAIEDETVFISTPRVYKPDEGYTLTTGGIRPSQAQLSGAGNQYPRWITDRYLQIPANLPQQVKRVSQNITRRIQTPYEKVVAVRSYLAQVSYDENGSFPPADTDAVEDFLNVQKKGNCTNFATSAVVLLRAAGVPARFCTGYIPHTFDKKTSTFYVEARDYHAWIEVYFPGYGWVEFEVTPGEPSELTSPELNAGQTDSSSSNPDLYYFDDNYLPPDDGAANAAAPPEDRWSRPVFISLAVLLLLAVGIELGLRAWSRNFQRADYAAETYAKLWFTASLLKMPGTLQQTPREFGESLASFIPEQKTSILDISRAYAEYRYGGNKRLDVKKKQELRHAWLAVSAAMMKKRIAGMFKGFSL